MKVEFVDWKGITRTGVIPEQSVSEPFVRLRGVEHGIFTVYRTTNDKIWLMLYRPTSPVRPDCVLETYFTEGE